jgi:Fe-S oxidoreductase
MEKGVKLSGVKGVKYMYHDPCHSPMKLQDPLKTVNELIQLEDSKAIPKNDRCCGESGTLAVTRLISLLKFVSVSKSRWKRAQMIYAKVTLRAM